MPEETVVQQEQAESAAKAEETKQAAASAAAETTETQTDQSAEGGQKPPEKGGVQRRIDELTKARRLAEAEAEFWRQKALGATPGDKSPTADSQKPKAKPNPADFETTEAYLEARDAWVQEETMRTVRSELEKRDQAYEVRSEQEILAAEWSEREAAAKEKQADYEQVTTQAMDALQASKGPAVAAIAHAVQYSEMGPEVLYYLGQHPEEVAKLSVLHPTQAVIALGRIEARLATETESGEKPAQTRAPKPPTPIRKAAPGATPEPDDPASDKTLSDDEWMRRRNEQLRKRAGR